MKIIESSILKTLAFPKKNIKLALVKADEHTLELYKGKIDAEYDTFIKVADKQRKKSSRAESIYRTQLDDLGYMTGSSHVTRYPSSNSTSVIVNDASINMDREIFIGNAASRAFFPNTITINPREKMSPMAKRVLNLKINE